MMIMTVVIIIILLLQYYYYIYREDCPCIIFHFDAYQLLIYSHLCIKLLVYDFKHIYLYPHKNIAFSILPSSQVVSVDEEAVFRCRHPTADFIGWIVNGSSVGTNPPPDVFVSTVQDDNGNTVHTLTIVGRPDYNGTTVVCEAFYRDTRPIELSPEALLQGILFVEASQLRSLFSNNDCWKISFISVTELNTYPPSR